MKAMALASFLVSGNSSFLVKQSLLFFAHWCVASEKSPLTALFQTYLYPQSLQNKKTGQNPIWGVVEPPLVL